MALMEFALFPMDKGESLSGYVAGTMSVIKDSGLPYRMNPMGTVVEGEWEELIALLTNAVKKMEEKSNRLNLSVRFDIRKGVTGALTKKIESVQAKSDFNVCT